MDRPMLIYIAGPYTADTPERILRNVEAAIDAGINVYRRGHYPYIPHFTHYVDERARQLGIPLTWEDFIRWDLPWLDRCDAILYLAKSRGADLELARAREIGKTIYYSVDDIAPAGRVVEALLDPPRVDQSR